MSTGAALTRDTMTRPTIRLGSRGDDVRAWQAYLVTRGSIVTVDGDYGPRTESATRIVQAGAGLTADGIVGPRTWALISEAGFEAPISRAHLLFDVLDLRLADASPELRRETVADIVGHFAGLGARETTPGRADHYALAIGRGESAAFRASYVLRAPAQNGNASCCGLLCRAVLALAGVVDVRIQPPYVFSREGGVIGQLQQLGRLHGALRVYDGSALPPVGAVVLVGPYRGHATGQHIYTTVDESGSSVDGGQGGGWGGGTEIAHVTRSWVREGGTLVTRSSSGDRPVVSWIDTGALRYGAAVTMPRWE